MEPGREAGSVGGNVQRLDLIGCRLMEQKVEAPRSSVSWHRALNQTMGPTWLEEVSVMR